MRPGSGRSSGRRHDRGVPRAACAAISRSASSSFLGVVERGVFAQPASPYRRLFEHAGIELGDVAAARRGSRASRERVERLARRGRVRLARRVPGQAADRASRALAASEGGGLRQSLRGRHLAGDDGRVAQPRPPRPAQLRAHRAELRLLDALPLRPRRVRPAGIDVAAARLADGGQQRAAQRRSCGGRSRSGSRRAGSARAPTLSDTRFSLRTRCSPAASGRSPCPSRSTCRLRTPRALRGGWRRRRAPARRPLCLASVGPAVRVALAAERRASTSRARSFASAGSR